MNDTLFTDQEDQQQINSYLEELVGEDKKFKTQEELAKAKFESDRYINTLTKRMDEFREENDKLREDANSRAALTDLLDQMKSQQRSNSEYTPHANDEKPTINPLDIENVVVRKLQEAEQLKKQQENLNIVRDKLKSVYGNNYNTYLQENTEKLGLTKEFVDNLARSYPEVLFRTLGVDQQTPTPPPSLHTRQRGDNFSPTTPHKRTWSYYQKMKAENPSQYSRKETTLQMHRDAIELGDSFMDGDW